MRGGKCKWRSAAHEARESGGAQSDAQAAQVELGVEPHDEKAEPVRVVECEVAHLAAADDDAAGADRLGDRLHHALHLLLLALRVREQLVGRLEQHGALRTKRNW